MIDCHCHLADKEFNKDIHNVIERSKNADIEAIVLVAEFYSDFKRILELTKLYENFIYPCFGIHPVQVRYTSVRYYFFRKIMNLQI